MKLLFILEVNEIALVVSKLKDERPTRKLSIRVI